VVLERDSLSDDTVSADVDITEAQSEQPLEKSTSDAFEWGSHRLSGKNKSGTRNAHPSPSISTEEEVGPARSKMEVLWDEFVDPIELCGGDTKPRQNEEPHEDYSDVFLCHAPLYVLAD
jgi:hypothetical protein